MNSCIHFILNHLFPTPCALCDELLHDGSRLCASCHALLPFFDDGCEQCGVTLSPSEGKTCAHCQTQPPAFDRTLTLFRYEKPADHWLQQLKFQQRLHYAPLLAGLFWQRHQERLQRLNAECLIPIPLHRKRLRKRGFNQALELARPLARALSLPLNYKALRRQRDTQQQSKLDAAERPRNVKDAFAWNNKQVPQRVLLVDDIITTGHTANSAALTLKQAGVKEVSLLAFARSQSS